MGRPVQVLDLAKSAEYWDFDKAVGVCNILRSGDRLGCMGMCIIGEVPIISLMIVTLDVSGVTINSQAGKH